MNNLVMNKDFPDRKHLRRIPVWISSNHRVIWFVTTCCANRRKVFAVESSIKIALESLVKASAATDWNIIQVCFMPDHVHLLLSPTKSRDQSLSKIMQRWKSSSKQRLNRNGIAGEIW